MKHKMQRAIRKALMEFPWSKYGFIRQPGMGEFQDYDWANDLSKRIAELFIGDDDPWYDLISLPGGLLLKCHSETVCQGQRCCLHNPSDHHMVSWDQQWDPQHEIMYRVCEHGELHPDLDDMYVMSQLGMVSHPCDGCCHPDGTVQVT